MSYSQIRDIEILIRARYPIIYIVSWEEARVVESLIGIGHKSNKKVYEWTCSGGIVPAGTSIQATKMRNAGTKDPQVALNEVVEQVESAIYIFKDFHPFLSANNFNIIRRLRDIAQNLKSSYKSMILLSPFLHIPPELEKDVTVVDFHLPNMGELGKLLDEIIAEVKENPKIHVDLSNQGREAILKAALGLTLAEAENVFAKALVSNNRISDQDVTEIFAEKRQIIRKSGLLDYCEPDIQIKEVGGLPNLKEWLKKRKMAFSDKASRFGLPAPKGVLLAGIQGCGKSMCAKAISSLWHLPLLRFDVGRMFSSPLGSSEDNIRRAINISESIAPCVLWVDELDKAFAAMGQKSTDSGATQRVLGTFLVWLSEKNSPVFVVATANNVEILPPELLRKGRFDEIFFVDLPSMEERQDIFKIHLLRRGRRPEKFDLTYLASLSEGFSGAEIEQAVISGLYDAFYQKRDICREDLEKALQETVPLSQTMAEAILKMRKWGHTRARPAAHTKSG